MAKLLRFVLSILTATALSAVAAVLGLYLLREPLLFPWVRAFAARELSAALQADVRIGHLSGDLLHTVRLEEIAIDAPADHLVGEVRGLSITVHLDPLDLLTGDLAGVRRLLIDAQEITLHGRGRLPAGEPAAEEEPATGELPDLGRLLPAGARIRAHSFAVASGGNERRGRLEVLVRPGAGEREREVDLHGPRLRGHLRGSWNERTVSGSLDAGDLGNLAAALGQDVPFTAGRAGVFAEADLAAGTVHGDLRLEGLVRDERRLGPTRATFRLGPSTLDLDHLEADLPGLTLRSSGIHAPLPGPGQETAWEHVTGGIELDITDLESWRDVLPRQVRALLPIEGHLAFHAAGGRLEVAPGELTSRGMTLLLEGGSVPMAALRDRDADLGELVVRLELEDAEIPVGKGALRTTGSLRARVTGSIAAPELHAELDLGTTEIHGHRVEVLSGVARYRGGELVADAIHVGGARPSGSEASSSFDLGGALGLPAGDGAPMTVSGSVSGTLAPGLWELAGAPQEVVEGAEPADVRAEWEIALATEGPSGSFGFELPAVRTGRFPEFAVAVRGNLHPDRVELVEGSLSGALDLTARGEIPLEATGEFALEVEAPELDVGRLSALFLKRPLKGSLALRGTVAGTRDIPDLELEIEGGVRELATALGDQWPAGALGPLPADGVDLAVRLAMDDTHAAVERLEVTGIGPGRFELAVQGRLPLGPEAKVAEEDRFDARLDVEGAGPPGPQKLPLRLHAEAEVTEEETAIASLSFSCGPGAVEGELRLGAGWSGFTRAVPVEGRLSLAPLELDQIPRAVTGLDDLDGTVEGTIEVGGTITEPEPTVALTLRRGSLLVAGAPRLEELRLDLDADAGELRMHDLHASLGHGPLTGEVTLRAPGDHTLWTAGGDLEVEARLTGDEVLLASTTSARVRADVAVEVDGDLGDLPVKGEVVLVNGRFAQRLTLLPDPGAFRMRGGASLEGGVVPFRLTTPIANNIHLDIGVRSQRPFQVRTHLFDSDLNLDLRLTGSAALPHLLGTVSAANGDLRFPGSTMEVDSLVVTFRESNPLVPELLLLAHGRRYGIDTELAITGPYNNPEVVLSTVPAMPPSDAWTLVTTGVPPDTLAAQGTQGQATILGAYLAQELAGWYTGGESVEETESFMERFTIESGREVGRDGQTSIVVEFEVTDNVYLQAERDIYSDYNGGVVLRWRFR